MPLSKEDIERIYSMRDKLIITFKATSSETQKKRVSKNLAKIEKIIRDIESGKEIDPKELHLFSNNVKKNDDAVSNLNRMSYLAKIEVEQISENNKDAEMNQIYSFFKFFETNLITPLGDNYIKLDYHLSKRRDVLFAHFEALRHLMKEYVDDLNILTELRIQRQIETYKSRVEQQKAYLLIRLSEFLHELKELLDEIIAECESGRNSFFNPDEIFEVKYLINDYSKTEYEGMKMMDIVYEALYFTIDFIEIVRMPDFRKKSR